MSKTKISRLASLFALVPVVSFGYSQVVFATGTQEPSSSNIIQASSQNSIPTVLFICVAILIVAGLYIVNLIYGRILVMRLKKATVVKSL
jgi:protein-S-isoprenylcysteine O-methyltransferase Ste14